ncbi:MAG: hypothetical protein HKP48_05520 [Winogradskyella sp.]|uniref:hypothetical protein n=1 Tax=Winogradskyella sp. TaxID=1883156 RepID=UPI001834C4C2|nr:hypothetical protein [Winogradskyella sp.]MBT8245415.1 hypothetical protein [Winogradskyella sp.]NNK22758.1 hypothetical protein [Winogradskyella sp.]
MNSNTKTILISILIFLVIFLIVFFGVRGVFNLTEGPISGIISAVAAAILSPRRKIIEKQSRKEVQLTWFFSKKIIRFK